MKRFILTLRATCSLVLYATVLVSCKDKVAEVKQKVEETVEKCKSVALKEYTLAVPEYMTKQINALNIKTAYDAELAGKQNVKNFSDPNSVMSRDFGYTVAGVKKAIRIKYIQARNRRR